MTRVEKHIKIMRLRTNESPGRNIENAHFNESPGPNTGASIGFVLKCYTSLANETPGRLSGLEKHLEINANPENHPVNDPANSQQQKRQGDSLKTISTRVICRVIHRRMHRVIL